MLSRPCSIYAQIVGSPIATPDQQTNFPTSYWPGCKALEPFDHDFGTVIQESTTNKLLAKAWEEAMKCEKEGKGIAYWRNMLASKKVKEEAQSCADGTTLERLPENRKRKGTPKCKLPPGYDREDSVDDDEGADTFLRQNDNEPKIKNEFSDSPDSDLLETNIFGEGHTSPHRNAASEFNKRTRLDSAGGFPAQPVTRVKGETQSRLATPFASSNVRFTPSHIKVESQNNE